MQELLEKIDKEVIAVQSDTNRGLTQLSLLLIDLAKMYWEAKQNYRKGKTSYEIQLIEKKEDRENQLLVEWKKITDAELSRYASACLINEYKQYKDDEAISEYLEPIINAYYNFINGVKWDSKATISVEKFYDTKM